jgi:ATP-dependent Clp protease ATP-binding subunit ClpX
MTDQMPKADSSDESNAQRCQKWLDNIASLHWSPQDYAKLALNKRVIGQDDAVQAMAVLVRQHVKRLQAAIQGNSWMLPPNVRETRPTLLIGSSGCGKTLLPTTVAKIASLPFACHDLTNLTAQGWVGMSTSDLVAGLLMRCDGQAARARWGLLFLDEFDKLRSHDTAGADVGGQGVQRSLLSLLDGGTIQVEWPPNGPREARTWQPFNCANLMVILTGAFAGLEDIVAKRVGGKRRIGFAVGGDGQGRNRHELLQQVTSEDLIQYGMIPEIVGRLNTVVMRDLSREALVQILTKAPDGPLAIQQRMAQRERFKLKLTDTLVDAIVDEALARGLGARPLHAMMTRVCQRAFYEVPSKINPFDDGSFTVTLGAQALVDGSYELQYRRRKRSATEQQKLVEEVRKRLGESCGGAAESADG